jgi:hypothetical protein
MPAALIAEHREHLAQLGEPVRQFVNRVVAHTDRRGVPVLPTFAELDAFIDEFGRLAKLYHLLLTGGGSLSTMTPELQEDWRGPFRQAWL